MDQNDTVKVNITRIDYSNIQSLEEIWSQLYSKTNSNAFLSPNWIYPWLDLMLKTNQVLWSVEANVNKEVCGLALFVETLNTRHKVFKYRQLWLHRSGNDALDQIWIEHNDFLIKDDAKGRITEAMWQATKDFFPHIDEFVVGLSHESQLRRHRAALPNMFEWEYSKNIGWSIALNKFPDIDAYEQSLSKQLQKQLRRSKSLIESKGFLITISQSKTHFAECWREIAPLHQLNWGETSGFNNDMFNQFFENFIDNCCERETFSVSIKKEDSDFAGAIVGFISNDVAYFYLSSNIKHTDNKIKIGLTLHHEVIRWCLTKGITKYDFLAGDYRYKRSFATDCDSYSMVFFQRRKLSMRIEHFLRKVKKKLARVYS